MALPARLVDSPPAERTWPWHTPKVGSVSVSLLLSGQRRMEAQAYLSDGHGLRLAIEAKAGGWVRFSQLATAAAPPRIKQVLVSSEHGVPYLNTSQVFDLTPKPRKWLAMGKTSKGHERLVKQGTILVMASATVGRAIVATKAHENTIISHHFMRVTPTKDDLAGWVYAYLRSPQAQAMISGAQYASVIRHIEPRHLATLPVPEVSPETAADFQTRVAAIVACRNKAVELREAAERRFSEAVGVPTGRSSEEGHSVNVSALAGGRRRFEASYHAPKIQSIIGAFKVWEPLRQLTSRIWWGNRFKRHYGDTGLPYMSADDVFTTNPYSSTRILVRQEDGHEDYFVRRGWLIMACSGQTYGLIGATVLATKWHENTFFSHDMIRIIPKPGIRGGYLLTALSHPSLGRPLLIREAYGMSVPHLDPSDIGEVPIVRLGNSTENDIADLAEEAASEQARAEGLERALAEEAGKVITEFLDRPSDATFKEPGRLEATRLMAGGAARTAES
jgi:hypothetical protein